MQDYTFFRRRKNELLESQADTSSYTELNGDYLGLGLY